MIGELDSRPWSVQIRCSFKLSGRRNELGFCVRTAPRMNEFWTPAANRGQGRNSFPNGVRIGVVWGSACQCDFFSSRVRSSVALAIIITSGRFQEI
jgi:hypothetical protein